MIIRLMNKGDMRGVFDVIYKTWITTYVSLDYKISKEDIDSFFDSQDCFEMQTLSNDKILRLVVDVDQNIVAVSESFIPKNKKNIIYIRTLYVDSRFQGRGIGKEILERIKKYFGNKAIFLETASYNKKGISFYIKNGFKIDPDWNGSFSLPTGKKIPLTRLVKNLA